MQQTIVGIGEILWDIFPGRKALGGAPTNFAYHCRQLGHRSYAVSAIGTDPLGEEMRTLLDGLDLEVKLQTNAFPTGTVQIMLDESGVPTYTITEQVAWDHLTWSPELEQLAQRTDAACFGSLAQRSAESADTIHHFLQSMPQGSMRVFDINLRLHYYTEEVLRQSLELATVLKLNDEELPVLASLFALPAEDAAACQQLREDFALDMVILTRGGSGAHIYHSGGSVFYPSARISVVDTVGAGDSFTAAFVSAQLAGLGLVESVARATELAAHVCQSAGAMPEVPASMRITTGE